MTIEGSHALVATMRGAVLAGCRVQKRLLVGDRVTVRNGIASRAPVAKQAFPV